MARFLFLPVMCIPLAVAAAPVPPEDDAAKLRRIYGTWHDPDKDCKYELTGGKLRITIPDKNHSLSQNPGLGNAPRVWREVEGDFTITVRVAFPIRVGPVPESTGPGNPVAAGGLLAWTRNTDIVHVVRRDQLLSGRPAETFVCHQVSPRGRAGNVAFTRYKEQADSGFLRLARNGKKVAVLHSRDGKAWHEFETFEVDWKDKVNVGILAENGYKTPFTVTFDQYTLTQPKK